MVELAWWLESESRLPHGVLDGESCNLLTQKTKAPCNKEPSKVEANWLVAHPCYGSKGGYLIWLKTPSRLTPLIALHLGDKGPPFRYRTLSPKHCQYRIEIGFERFDVLTHFVYRCAVGGKSGDAGVAASPEVEFNRPTRADEIVVGKVEGKTVTAGDRVLHGVLWWVWWLQAVEVGAAVLEQRPMLSSAIIRKCGLLQLPLLRGRPKIVQQNQDEQTRSLDDRQCQHPCHLSRA